MAISYSTHLKNALLNTAANGGTGFSEVFKDSVISVYSGLRPPSADSGIGAAVWLADFTLDGQTFTPGNPANGLNWTVSTAGTIDKPSAEDWKFIATNNGIASFFRLKGNGTDTDFTSTVLPRLDGDIGVGLDADIGSTSIFIGETYNLITCSFIWP